MTDQLREAAQPLNPDELAYVRQQVETIRRFEAETGRISSTAEHVASRLLATLDATPPGVDVERLAEAMRRHYGLKADWDLQAEGIAAEYARLGDTR
jgi:hypothetical protein